MATQAPWKMDAQVCLTSKQGEPVWGEVRLENRPKQNIYGLHVRGGEPPRIDVADSLISCLPWTPTAR